MSEETIKQPDNSVKEQKPKHIGGKYPPGVSGNLSGRPLGSKNKKTLQKELLIDYLTQEIINSKGDWVPALLEGMRKGNIQAIKEGLDRAFGKSIESLDITTGGDKIYTWKPYGKQGNNRDIRPKTVEPKTTRGEGEVESNSSPQESG